jgi:hypothetical protein
VHRVEKIRRRLRRGGGPQPVQPEAGLRHGGLYVAPSGEKLVAAAAPGGRYILYHPLVWAGRAWVVNMPVAYVVTEKGHVATRSGEPTGWRIEDLGRMGCAAEQTQHLSERDSTGG